MHSSYREMVLEHILIGDILRYMWKRGPVIVDILKPQVDRAGYDLVLECNSVIRHVQLKTSHADARTAHVSVHLQLGAKPSGCVIWYRFDPDSLGLGPYYWFGGPPGGPLPSIADLRIAKTTKGDATGMKKERLNFRLIPKSKFTKLISIKQLVERLFGPIR